MRTGILAINCGLAFFSSLIEVVSSTLIECDVRVPSECHQRNSQSKLEIGRQRNHTMNKYKIDDAR